MYSVSDAYKTAIEQPVQHHDLRGTVGSVAFGRENIISGSFEITNQCSGSTSLQIGQVYTGELTAVFTGLDIPRYSWKGKRIAPEFGIRLAGGTFEYVPLGVFTVSEADTTDKGVEITAYDNMERLDKALTRTLQGLSPYQIASIGCTACGVTLGSTETQIRAMANGTEVLYMSADGDVQSWRDVFSWLGQTLGAFVTAGRDGKIYFRQYGREAVDVLDNYHRFAGCKFADYETRYTGISITSIANKTTSYFGAASDTGLTYNLGSNPFLQMEAQGVIERRCRAILSALQAVRYVPFEASAFCDPAYDLGDVLRFADGIADGTRLSCLTLYDFKFQQSYDMAGVGENPSLSSAKSKTDKAIDGLMSNGTDAFRLKATRNELEINVQDQAAPLVILTVRYSTASNSLILVQAEIRIDITTTETGDASTAWTCNDAVCRVTYKSDGEVIAAHHPVETWQDGAHILSLIQDVLVAQNYRHEFQILLELGGGTGVIAPGDAAIYISGIGVDDEVIDSPVDPEGRYLTHIEVTTPPDKTEYEIGEALDFTGVVITAYYSDGGSSDVTRLCTFSPAEGAETEEAGPLMVEVSYTEGGDTCTASFDVEVKEAEPQITGIYVYEPPDDPYHTPGAAVDYTGVLIYAQYDDGSEEDVTERCTFDPADGTVIAAGALTVLVSLLDGETTHTTTFGLAERAALESIEVTIPPDKTWYALGADADYTGVEITAHYTDGSSAVVTELCTFSPAEGSTLTELGEVTVAVEYTEEEQTAATAFVLHVAELAGDTVLKNIRMQALGASGAVTIPRV